MNVIVFIKKTIYSIFIDGIFKNIAPAKWYLSFLYRYWFGYSIDWKTPRTFNEKIQWLKLYDKNPLYSRYADKVLVRDFVRDTIGEKYLIEVLKVYDNPSEISLPDLPNEFIMKLNTGSSCNIICHDKKNIDEKEIKRKFRKWYKQSFHQRYKEFHYKAIKKKIICERLLKNSDGTPLFDYKIFCFNGEPYLIAVELGEKFDNKKNLYKIDWTRHEGFISRPQSYEYEVPKPKCYEELLDCARKLSADFKEVRVDFYIIDGKIYFGEMTFTSAGGFGLFSSYEFDLELGSKFSLRDK